MHFQEEIIRYLNGEAFSSGAKIQLNINSPLRHRDNVLQAAVAGKKVLHIGFVDHLPVIDEKIKRGIWLHQKLIDSASLCVGIDINQKGIKHLKENHQIGNIYCLDILRDELPEELSNNRFDIILLPDVIEHIPNPQIFLNGLRAKLGNLCDQIIITTPNAFRLENFLNNLIRKEVINSDHRFWFTPFTISKILYDSGFSIEHMDYCQHGRYGLRKLIQKILIKVFPTFRDTLIVQARL